MATYEANYSIFLTDPALVASAQRSYPNGIVSAPDAVAATYGIIPAPSTFPPNDGTGDAIWTYGLGSGTSGLTPAIGSVTIPANFTIDSFNNLVAFAGSAAGTLQWRGYFLGRAAPGPVTKETLRSPRWIVGFERADNGEQEVGSIGQRMNRAASRTIEGMGLALRSPNNEFVTMNMPTPATNRSWERIYIQVLKYPTVNEEFIGWLGSGEAGSAGYLAITPSGNLAFYNKGNQVFPGTLVATSGSISLNQWVKLDILLFFASVTSGGGGNGGLQVFINGTMAMSAFGQFGVATGGVGGLYNTIQNHTQSKAGNEVASNGLEINYDDWTNKTQPQLFTGDDWTQGTHIMPLGITGLDTGHDAWVGDFRLLDATPVAGQVAAMTTSTPSLRISLTTDYIDRQAGCSALQMSIFTSQANSTAEQIGYAINGGASVLQNIRTDAAGWGVLVAGPISQILYSAGGQLTAPALTTVGLRYVRDAAGTARGVKLLYGAAEYIGVWGPEDPINLSDPSVFPPRQGPHNSPYYDQTFAQNAFSFGTGNVEVMAGTYVGNGTGQDITLQLPAHWVWIRPLTAGNGGSRWWSSMLAGHGPLAEGPTKDAFVRAFQFPAGSGVATSYKFRVSGTAANSNNTGVTYQYVAFSDRSMRHVLNGAYLTLSGTASFTHPLFSRAFTPDAGFLLPELATASGTSGLYYKGPGHAATAASVMDSAEAATVCAFGAGNITPKTILNLQTGQTAYSLWRILDGDGINNGVAITSYTGDGAASRVIPLSLNGRGPIFAIVQPHNGIAFQRDPSHTGANSSAITAAGGTFSTTAITAGTINQITVGLALNALGVVYDVFALPGTATAGWTANPASPIPIADPTPPVANSPLPAITSLNGWWSSTIKFTGSATLQAFPPTNPHDARDWSKIGMFALGNAGFYGGFPAPGCTIDHNFFVYAGNDYQPGGTPPTIRIFDGLSDRSVITMPDAGTATPLAIMAMLAVGEDIYVTTLDSGLSAADWSGRVFQFNPITLQLTLLGAAFTGGEVPYALCWHMGRLFLGTNKGDGTAAKVYFFRPGIDTVWTQDYTLTTSAVGGAMSMASYLGLLYVGCNATAAMATNKIVVRDTAGAYTTSYTATGVGTFRASNGFPSMKEFKGKLYASYWNPDTPPVSQILQFDGIAWTVVYTGAGVTQRPFINLFVVQDTLFAVGGGSGLSACLLSSNDGVTWTDLTAFLPGPATSTALPIVGQIGL
jgi:hypothetical protein